MTTDPTRGYGAIPYGHGGYGYGLTFEGENEAEIEPADLDLSAQPLAGSSGVSAAIVPDEIEVEGQDALGIVPPELPIKAGRVR